MSCTLLSLFLPFGLASNPIFGLLIYLPELNEFDLAFQTGNLHDFEQKDKQ